MANVMHPCFTFMCIVFIVLLLVIGPFLCDLGVVCFPSGFDCYLQLSYPYLYCLKSHAIMFNLTISK